MKSEEWVDWKWDSWFRPVSWAQAEPPWKQAALAMVIARERVGRGEEQVWIYFPFWENSFIIIWKGTADLYPGKKYFARIQIKNKLWTVIIL